MKKRRNRDYWLIVLIIAGIFILTGISMGWIPFLSGREDDPSLISITETESSQQLSISHAIEVPYTWQEEIDERNIIHAEIDIPDAIREQGFRKASAKTKEIDSESILTLLEDYYHPYQSEEYDDVIQYRGEDALYLYIPKQGNLGISVTSTLRDYIYMAYKENPREEGYNRELYSINGELEGFSLEECKKKMREICSEIGIPGEIGITYRALDYRMMEEQAEELHMDGSVTKPDYNWTPSDNSYHCTISQLCNDIPVIQTYMLTAYADILNYGDHTCVLNKERIISMYVNEVYEIIYEQGYEKLLDFSEILDKYRGCTELILSEYSTEVTDITLRVIALSQGKGIYKMTPIWIFYGTSYGDASGEIIAVPYAVMINALTGEEIG